MRRNDREMPKEFAYEVSDKCEWAVISMIDKYNMPYCVPISIVRDSEFIYFHCSNAGTKSESLKLNNSICISCVGDTKRIPEKFTTEYESVIIKGIAFEVLDKTEKIHALKLLCLRHASTNMDGFSAAIEKSLNRTAVWKIKILEITGKQKKYNKDGKELKFGRME